MPRQAIHRIIIHRHSGWIVLPLFGLAVLLLCGLFLLWYLRPVSRDGMPTGDTAPVMLRVQGLRLSVPANHIETAAARMGGAQAMLALFALYPGMRGYSPADAHSFAGDAPESRVIHLILRADPNSMRVRDRLARIYAPALADPAGAAAPFGLTHYAFRPRSVYSRDDLFMGDTSAGPVLMLCGRTLPDLPAPNCLATTDPPAKAVSLSYRFKRTYLRDWRRIAAGVDGLMRKFRGN